MMRAEFTRIATDEGGGGWGSGRPIRESDYDHMDPDAVRLFQAGIDQLAVQGIDLLLRDHGATSATHRGERHGQSSRHFTRHVGEHVHESSAMDFHTSHLTADEKREVIATFVGLGARGLGFYTDANGNPTGSMHFDFRGTLEEGVHYGDRVALWGHSGATGGVSGADYPDIVREGINEGLSRFRENEIAHAQTGPARDNFAPPY